MAVSYYQQHRPREATITVSQGDPTQNQDYSGDFVCSGAADDVEMQAAIDYVEALVGGSILLQGGNYDITATITPTVGNITLEGVNRDSVVLTLANNADAHMINIVSIDNIIIKNLTFDGNKANQGVGVHAIRCFDSNNFVAKDLKIFDAYNYGIFISSVNADVVGTYIENCNIDDCGLNCLHLAAGIGFIHYNALVVGGRFGGSDTGDGIECVRTNVAKIVGVEAYENDVYGISADVDAKVIITDSRVWGNTISGVEGNLTADFFIAMGNYCYDNTSNGIVCSCQAIIMGNKCYNNTLRGIQVSNSNAEGTIIEGNICWDNVYGMYLSQADNLVVVGNRCYDSGAATQTTGIWITNTATGTIVKNNMLIGNTVQCINDLGIDTKLATKTFQFVQGTTFISADGSAKGWEINAEADMAVALRQLPLEVQQVVRIKIWAVALGAPVGAGGQMHLDILFNAGGSLEAWNLAANSWTLANFDSEEADYVNTNVLHWVVEDGDVGTELRNLLGGDSLELKVNGGTAAAPDGATNATFRVIEIEYV